MSEFRSTSARRTLGHFQMHFETFLSQLISMTTSHTFQLVLTSQTREITYRLLHSSHLFLPSLPRSSYNIYDHDVKTGPLILHSLYFMLRHSSFTRPSSCLFLFFDLDPNAHEYTQMDTPLPATWSRQYKQYSKRILHRTNSQERSNISRRR